MTTAFYLLMFGVLAALGCSVVWGLWWSLKGGQFANTRRAAMSIFDEDEPVGQVTDAFPGEQDQADAAGSEG